MEDLTPAQLATVEAIARNDEEYAPYKDANNSLSTNGRQLVAGVALRRWGISGRVAVVAICRAIYAWSHSGGGTMGGKILVFPLQGMAAALREWLSDPNRRENEGELMFI
jgi:hypothetical protein